MNDAIGYVRVSSEEQVDRGLGLQAQRQRITAFFALKELRLADVYEDAGVFWGNPLASRPAGSRLLNAARRGKVVVAAAGRGRNVVSSPSLRGATGGAISPSPSRQRCYGDTCGGLSAGGRRIDCTGKTLPTGFSQG